MKIRSHDWAHSTTNWCMSSVTRPSNSFQDKTKASTYLVGDLRSLGSLCGLSKEDKGDREDQEHRDEESLEGNHDAWLCLFCKERMLWG
jgi:hypothetical protein